MDLDSINVFISAYKFWVGLVGGLFIGVSIGFIIAGILGLEPPEVPQPRD